MADEPSSLTRSKGRPEAVCAEVKRIIETLGRTGDYRLSSVHTVMPDVPPESILAMVDAALEFRRFVHRSDNG